jgi:thiosulfate/3-mercaptopyruvate sulfurtransferase
MRGARRVFALSIVAAIGLIGLTGSAAERESPYGSGVVKLVSTEWLQNHLKDANLVIVDAQTDVYDYLGQHIPGAVHLSDQTLRAPDHGMPVRYLSPQAVELLFCRVGLRNDVPVVVYTGKGAVSGTGDGLGQTMVAYTLARFGQNSIYVLDGGLDKWVAEKRPVSKEFPQLKEGTFKVSERDCHIAMDQLKELMNRDDVIIIDARGVKAYEGQAVWSKSGHIPGAICLPWRSLMADNNPALLKSDQEIAEILKQHNITPDKTIVTYCGTGREATNPFLLFKCYLGFPNVKLYEGSFTEWSSYPDNPTVVGPNPK